MIELRNCGIEFLPNLREGGNQMKLCFETEIAGYKIALYQTGGTFTVIYGCHKVEDVEYGQACQELGQCIFHALACEGKLDNGE